MKDVTELREQCRELLKHPKPPGPWWKQEVLEREQKGLPVTISAHELAANSTRIELKKKTEEY